MTPRIPPLPTESVARPEVVAHVDGACDPNPGRGGWGAVLRSGPHERRLSGVIPEDTTNQRAEIHAAIRALTALKMPCRVRILSDSQYLVRTMNGDYRRRANLDLWGLLDAAAEPHEVEWVWCRGHAGEPDNETAHRLAEGEVESAESPFEPCEPREIEGDVYYCGKALSMRNVEGSKIERCLGGVIICPDCFGDFDGFMGQVKDRRAVEQEWEED